VKGLAYLTTAFSIILNEVMYKRLITERNRRWPKVGKQGLFFVFYCGNNNSHCYHRCQFKADQNV